MRLAIIIASVALFSACATNNTAPASNAASQTAPAPKAAAATPAPTGKGKEVKSVDGSFTGEIIGTPAAESKFAKLKIGMRMSEVHALIKAPDDMLRHETGKRWIPFYFGSDAQRVETYYIGEGCLTYTGGNVFGGSGGQLIRITVDTTKACFDS